MRRSIRNHYGILAFAVLIAASTAVAQDPRKKAEPRTQAGEAVPPAPDPAKMKTILKDWESISSGLTSLEVDIKRVDDQKGWDQEVFFGEAKLASPNLAYLNFNKVNVDPKNNKPLIDPKTGKPMIDPKNKLPAVKPHERIVCTGSEVWQYVVETTQIYVFPLAKEDQKRALEEGPLPFLFNMEAAKAEERYAMSLIKEEGNYFVIGVLPKQKIDKAAFSQALIRLNKKTYFPDAIMLVATDGKSTKLFTLSNPKANRKIDPVFFKGVVYGTPWTVVRDPGNEQAPPAQGGNAAAQPVQPKRAAQGAVGNRPR